MNITVGLLRWLADTFYGEAEMLNAAGDEYRAIVYDDAADVLADLADEISRG